MKRWYRALCVVFAIALILTGWTGVAVDVAAMAGSAGEPIELFSQKPENTEIYNEIIAEFMQENPGTEIILTSTTGGTNFVARVAANDVPDMATIYFHPTYFAMMDEGMFVDQKDEAYISKINDTVIDLVTYTDGNVYVLPVTLNGYGLYINKKIYAEHGLSVPTTIEQLFDNCEKLKAAGVTPFAFPYKGPGDLGQNFERFLGGAVDHDAQRYSAEVAAGKSYNDFPELRNYLELFYKLTTEYSDAEPLSLGYDDVTALFTNEKVAMVLNGTWGCAAYAQANPDLDYETVLVPTITGIAPTSAGTADTAIAISSSSKNIDTCKAFLEFFVRDDIAQRFAEWDKNPTAVKAVDYVVPNMEPLMAGIHGGGFSLIPSAKWPAGFRDEIQVELQQLLLDGDIDAFFAKWETITHDFFNK